MKILVIDDDEQVRRIVRKGLQPTRRGMDLVRLDRPPIVATDLFMPEKEGIATILGPCRDHPDSKIITISAVAPLAARAS